MTGQKKSKKSLKDDILSELEESQISSLSKLASKTTSSGMEYQGGQENDRDVVHTLTSLSRAARLGVDWRYMGNYGMVSLYRNL